MTAILSTSIAVGIWSVYDSDYQKSMNIWEIPSDPPCFHQQQAAAQTYMVHVLSAQTTGGHTSSHERPKQSSSPEFKPWAPSLMTLFGIKR